MGSSVKQRAARDRTGRVFIGTSGWQYRHWRETFYPPDTPVVRELEHYSTVFSSVEINNSFYRLPEKKTFAGWKARTADDFVFSVKASRFITHNKKLSDPKPSLRLFFERAVGLGDKLGCILFQLPPRWGMNAQRLRDFLELLPRKHRYTFEFRHHSWFCDEVFDALRQHNVALCLYDLAGWQTPVELTAADYVYIRLHGPVSAYRGQYTDAAIDRWADQACEWMEAGRDVFCFFDKD
jgi:uncharacterized protein YecE (DUF72 family)